MDLYKDAVTNELRQMLTAFEGVTQNPTTSEDTRRVCKLRNKIHRLCNTLDRIEYEESRL